MKTKFWLLLLTLTFSLQVFSFDFVVNNIAYNITSSNTVETTWNDQFMLTGDIVIPAQVQNATINYTVTAIGPNTFNGCGSQLKSVSIPTTIVSVGHYAFFGCSEITDIVLPSLVSEIGERAFCGCSKLKAITIPKSVTVIKSEVFMACDSLSSLTFETPSSVGVIDYAAFEYCSKLKSIELPNSVRSIAGRAFQFCAGLETINIPSSVNTMGIYAFDDTPWFNNQPEGMVYAGNVLYTYKGNMAENTSLILKNGTTGIAQYAFYSQRNLVAITIPASVTAMGTNVFEYCSGLNAIYCHSATPINLETAYSAFKDANTTTSTLYVPVGAKSAYQMANQWQDFVNITESYFTSLNKTTNKPIIYTQGKSIIVNSSNATHIYVYDARGIQICSLYHPASTVSIPINTSGMYIVWVDGIATKFRICQN